MAWQDYVIIESEVLNSEARAKLVKLHGSWFAAEKVEETLRKRRAEVEEEIKQLKLSLELPFLREDVRDSITARISVLENSPLVEVLSGNYDDLLESKNPAIFLSYAPECVCHQTIFIAEYLKDNVHWRAVQVCIKSRTDFNQSFPCTKPSMAPSCPLIGFNKDSLSHFQNCRVPPPTTTRTCSRTQNRFAKLLTKGCFVGIPQHIILPRSYEGGLKWTESRKRWTNVSEPYKELLLIYPRNSKISFAGCTTSSKNTRKSQKEPYQSYSDFIATSLKAIMLKHSASSFSCLFLSHSKNGRNEDSLVGEID